MEFQNRSAWRHFFRERNKTKNSTSCRLGVCGWNKISFFFNFPLSVVDSVVCPFKGVCFFRLMKPVVRFSAKLLLLSAMLDMSVAYVNVEQQLSNLLMVPIKGTTKKINKELIFLRFVFNHSFTHWISSGDLTWYDLMPVLAVLNFDRFSWILSTPGIFFTCYIFWYVLKNLGRFVVSVHPADFFPFFLQSRVIYTCHLDWDATVILVVLLSHCCQASHLVGVKKCSVLLKMLLWFANTGRDDVRQDKEMDNSYWLVNSWRHWTLESHCHRLKRSYS